MLWAAISSNEIAGIAVFDSQSNFHKNATDSAQDQWYQQLRFYWKVTQNGMMARL